MFILTLPRWVPARIYFRCANFIDWVLYHREGICHCGGDMDKHGWGDGHAPVEMYCLRKYWCWLTSDVQITLGADLCLKVPLP